MKKGKMMKNIVLVAIVTSAILIAGIFGTPIKSFANEVANQGASRIIETRAALLTNELTGTNQKPMSVNDVNYPVTKAAIPVDLLKNIEFKGFDNWTPIWWNETFHHGGDDWIEPMNVTIAKFTAVNNEGFSGVSNRTFQARANSDGSVDLRGGVRSNLSFDETGQDEYFDNQGGIFQTFATIPGHTYQFKAKQKVTEESPDDYKCSIHVGSGDVPNIPINFYPYELDKKYKDSVQFKATSTVSNISLRVQGDAVIQFSELELYDKTDVAPTIITSASDIMDPQAGVISGTGEPNSTVRIYESIYNNGFPIQHQIASGIVGMDGKWSFSIPVLSVTDDYYGYYNRVYATTETDGFIAKSQTLPIATLPYMTVQYFMYGEDTYVQGRYMGLITQVELQVNNEAKERVKVTNEKILYDTKNYITSDMDKVKLVGYNSAGKKIYETVVFVIPEPKPGDGELVVEPYVVGQKIIEGTSTGKVAKVSLIVNNEGSGKNPVLDDGSFKCYSDSIKFGDKVTVIGYNYAGRKICETRVAVLPKNFAIALSDYRVATDYIEGRYTGPVAQVGVIVNGIAKQQINVTGGTIKYYAKPLITKTTDKVTLVGYNSEGLVVGQKDLTIKEKVSVTPSPYYTDSQYVKGTYTGDVGKISLTINGVEGTKIPATGNNFQYYSSAKLIKNETDVVYLNTYDGLGKFINKTLIPVLLKGKIADINIYQISTDNYVVGSYTGAVSKVSLTVNGTESAKISVSGNNFQYYAAKLITKTTDMVYLNTYDSLGNFIDRKYVQIAPEGKITVPSYYVIGRDSYVISNYTGDIKKVELQINGVAKQRINVADGAIKYYAKSLITKATDKVTLVGYDSRGSAVSYNVIPISENISVTAEPFTLGTSYVSGTYTGTLGKVSLTVNGVEGSQILVAGNKFQYYAAKVITNATDVVYLNTYDRLGNFVNKTLVPIIPKGQITEANSYKIGTDSYVLGKYTGGITKVELQVNSLVQQRITVTDGMIKYYAKPLITKATDKVTLVGYNSMGSAVSSKTINIQ